MLWIQNNNPIEKYILNVLRKNQHNVDLAFKEIYSKYSMFKKYDLHQVITELLNKKVNNEKVTGVWRKIDKKWKLINGAYEWSGKELPADIDQNSTGNNLGTYSKPNGQPTNYTTPEPKMKHDVPVEKDDENVTDDHLQLLYNALFDNFKDSFESVNELNTLILQELMQQGYGDKILRVKLNKELPKA